MPQNDCRAQLEFESYRTEAARCFLRQEEKEMNF